MAVIAPSSKATRDNKQSRGNPVTPSHNPIKALAKDVSGTDSDSRNDLFYAISVNPVDLSMACGACSVGNGSTFNDFLSPLRLAYRTFTEEILDPKGVRKMVCGATGESLSMLPATLLLRLSEVSQQHGRATRWLADNPVPIPRLLWMGLAFCA